MNQEDKINRLETKIIKLEEKNRNLAHVLSCTMHLLRRVTHIANNTYYDYSNEEKEIVAELNRLSNLL